MAFDTPNTKNRTSWGVLNVLKFWNILQYRSIFGTVRKTMLKNKIIFYLISLSSFMTLSSLSFFSSFFPASLHLLSSLLFLLFLLLSFSRTSTSPFFFLSFFFPFFLFYHFLSAASPSISFFFFSLSLSLSVFFFLHLGRCHWDQSPPWSSASPGSSASLMRSSLWRSGDLLFWSPSFFFFSLRLWIPCDCDYGWVGSFSSSFFWDSFVLIWWIFVGGGGFYLWVVVVGCAWVWWWWVVLCISVWWGFFEDFNFFFFFFWVWILDLEFIRGSMIVVVVCGSDCWFLDGGDCH